MIKHLISYAAAALIFFPLDFVWLSTMGRNFYFKQLDGLLLDQPNLSIAGLFYLAYLAGVVVLVVAQADGNVIKAALMGAVLGFVAYGTYDLTNLSTVKGFTAAVAMVDMAWGTVLTAAAAAAGTWASRFWG